MGSASPRPKRAMAMLSRWPENHVEPREATTRRQMAIKDDKDHPLRCLYVKAPAHWDADPSESERCAIVARQKLSALRMLPAGLTEKRKTWVERVFLEWVAVAVGARDRTGKKVQKCQNRRREFFTDGPLHSGCRIHLHRREERASLFDEETPRTPQLSKKPPALLFKRDDIAGMRHSHSAGELVSPRQPSELPPGLNSRLAGMLNQMHTPLGGMAGTYGAAAM